MPYSVHFILSSAVIFTRWICTVISLYVDLLRMAFNRIHVIWPFLFHSVMKIFHYLAFVNYIIKARKVMEKFQVGFGIQRPDGNIIFSMDKENTDYLISTNDNILFHQNFAFIFVSQGISWGVEKTEIPRLVKMLLRYLTPPRLKLFITLRHKMAIEMFCWIALLIDLVVYRHNSVVNVPSLGTVHYEFEFAEIFCSHWLK